MLWVVCYMVLGTRAGTIAREALVLVWCLVGLELEVHTWLSSVFIFTVTSKVPERFTQGHTCEVTSRHIVNVS